MLLHEQFEKSVHQYPGKIALIADEQRYTYSEIARLARQLALVMREEGIQQGDRVALYLNNSLEMVAGMFAALKLGAVFIPVNPQTKSKKLAYVLNDARATCLISEDILKSAFLKALEHNDTIKLCLTKGECPGNETGFVKYYSFSDIQQWDDSLEVTNGTIDQDLAAIIYTSGSTGEPKGVMLSHLNMLTAANSVSAYLGLHQDDIISCSLPLSFDYGLYQVLMAAKLGATVILEPSFAFPQKVLMRMQDEKATVFPGVPTMFTMLMQLESLLDFDLSHLRLISNTAAALSERQIKELRQLFPGAQLFSMYGLTECKRVSYLPPEQLTTRPTSIGRGMPNQEMFLVDGDGKRLPHGSEGELVIRGSHVMKGYWEKPEQTATRLRRDPISGDTLLYSGDIFRTDNDGYYYFVARKDDIIKTRGEKVSPREVENVIHGLEGVLECAVIGVEDELFGRAIKAFIVLRDGINYSEADVIRFCNGSMENYMVPKYVAIVTQLPRTDTGKITKKGLV
jgi:long-chain acyl-CoA synthetase